MPSDIIDKGRERSEPAATTIEADRYAGKKVMLMAGGTGGHVIPALSLAERFMAGGLQVEWLGSPQGIENRLVPAAGIALNHIDVVGLRGKGLLRKLMAPFLVLNAVKQALVILRRFKPDFVVGLGGFASGPGGIAARILGIPVFIHEQNAVAGMTNRWLSKVARQTFAAFPGAFDEKVGAIVTGNPVRESLLTVPDKSLHSLPLNILVIGGSLGAQVFNERLPEALSKIPPEVRPYVWHQAGKGKLGATEESYQHFKVAARTQEFIDDMTGAFDWADLVICRAGALTVSELAAAGRASVLVPLPIAVDDHQTANARFLVEADAGILLPQKEMDADHLSNVLRDLVSNPEKIITMGKNARRVARPLATEAVVQGCLEKRFG
ncbi:undecaprenyldiphospho-muramoylpentapeptide beta-N-acetylglucosaminyltransferase [Oceanospirillum linum]|nr:UDP-N-acetylglucosamine-N-acetylmuramylpentapeptide N-acetylglucosamine transferase [Oleiphilus messinensis]SMP05345.1 UDP-N-acetylglucosamine-N-acetylmuramylpentapeptide N-acetylglucosamine transferase [Oceanospirillum linum]